MTFASITFLLFLPLIFALHWTLRTRMLQNAVLLGASLLFYGWWDWRFLGLLLFARSRMPPSNEFLAAALDKQRRLREAPGPRIVFVGGSSVAFGVDSPLLEARLGRAVVNMGLYAPLGFEFMLNQADCGLSRGDAVVISPELSLLMTPAMRPALVQLLREDPLAIRWFGSRDLKWFLDQGHAAAGAEARRVLRATLLGTDEPPSTPPYSRDSFNLQGDVVKHGPRSPRAGMTLLYEIPDPADPAFQRGMARLNEFADDCRRRGIEVFFAFPPLVREAVDSQRDRLALLDRTLRDQLRIPMLGTFEDMAQPFDRFHDSSYHLDSKGRRARADLITDGLRKRLMPSR